MSTKCRLLQEPSHKLVTFYDRDVLFFYSTTAVDTINSSTSRVYITWVSHIAVSTALKKAEEIRVLFE